MADQVVRQGARLLIPSRIRRARLLLLLFSAACGPTLARSREAIIGGTQDSTDTAVYALILDYYSSTNAYLGSALCSSTLIASHTLVTAAHCVDPRGPQLGGVAPQGSVTMDIHASNVTDVNGAPTGDFIHASLFEYSPSWDPATLTGDVGMVLLAAVPTQAPKPWNTTDLSADLNQPIRVVGYGITDATGSGAGTREEVDLTMLNIVSDHFEVGNGTQGICHGDSGGPSYATLADGIERVVGIHSYTLDATCTAGEDTRIDAYQAWISGWIDQHDPPSCALDGFCVSACSPADPDCVPVGSSCITASECDSRLCSTDPQHPMSYCSKSCATGADCPTGMDCAAGECIFHQLPTVAPGQSCTFGGTMCLDNTKCTGPIGGTTRCQLTCGLTADCPLGQQCAQGQNGLDFCEAPPKTLPALSTPQVEGRKLSGCGAAGGGPLAALALAWLALLVRRKAAPGVLKD